MIGFKRRRDQQVVEHASNPPPSKRVRPDPHLGTLIPSSPSPWTLPQIPPSISIPLELVASFIHRGSRMVKSIPSLNRRGKEVRSIAAPKRDLSPQIPLLSQPVRQTNGPGILEVIHQVDGTDINGHSMLNGSANAEAGPSSHTRSRSRSPLLALDAISPPPPQASQRSISRSPARQSAALPSQPIQEASLEGGRSLARSKSPSTSPDKGGTANEPIDLVDSDDESSPQGSAALLQSEDGTPPAQDRQHQNGRAGRHRKASRPNISQPTQSRTYEWLQEDKIAPQSPIPVPSPRFSSFRYKAQSSKAKSNKNRLHAIQSSIIKYTMKGDEETRRAGMSVAKGMEAKLKRRSRGSDLERIFRQRDNSGLAGGLAKFRLMLKKETQKSVDDATRKLDPVADLTYKASKQAKEAQRISAKQPLIPIADIIEGLQKQKLDEERKIQRRLRPPAPSRMRADRLRIAQTHLQNGNFTSQLKNSEVHSSSLRRLRDGSWLDDEIMNFYGTMIQDRSEGPKTNGHVKTAKIRDVHYFNSFFFAKLQTQGYEGAKLKRWTKKVDIFSKDLVVFPINLGNMHWTAGAINFREKRLEYYDSLGDHSGQGETIFSLMEEYLDQEHMDKKGTNFDFDGWTSCFGDDSPQQDNGSDCGVFSCQTLEALARGNDLTQSGGIGFDFSADNMRYLRKLMVLEIGQGRLEPRWPDEGSDDENDSD